MTIQAQTLAHYRTVQSIAKQTVAAIEAGLRPGMTLRAIRALAEDKLLELGADSFWYHGVGAFVFAGAQTALSVSGRTYKTPDYALAPTDILTIDLSPQRRGVWGDYARTILMQDGAVMSGLDGVRSEHWRRGLEMEDMLHDEMRAFVTPDTTFEGLYEHINGFIVDHGFVNLDYLGNLGHSIERRPEDRLYTEKGNKRRLGDVSLFTFEPHISTPGSCYGYKKENIYYFEGDALREL